MILKRQSATKGLRYIARVHRGRGSYDYGPTRSKRSEARADEKRMEGEVPTKGFETVQQFSDRWLTDYIRETGSGKDRWGATTLRNYRSTLALFCRGESVDGKAYGSIELRRFPKEEARRWAANAAESQVRTIRAMFSDALRYELVSDNPFSKLRLSRSKGRRDIVPLIESEVHELAQIASERHPGAFGQQMSAALLTLAYVGCRPGELFALRPEDVHLEDGMIDVRRAWNAVELKLPKNGRERLGLILPPPAAQAIAKMAVRLDSEWLFPTKTGKHFRQYTWQLAWEPVRSVFNERLDSRRRTELAVARGKDEMDAYELRHTAASILLDRGVSAEDVGWQLGHTDEGHLVRTLYGHPSEELRRQRLRQAFAEPIQLREVQNQ